jgi:activator of HSP90 ATPase
MPESIQLSTILTASPEQLYKAWLSSKEHAAFTGSSAQINPNLNGDFTAWDGYIQGKNLELKPYQRIVQAWRTTEFPADSPDSHLEILFEAVQGGTKITLIHTEIPDGQGKDYFTGWEDFYFKPMMEYFAKKAPRASGQTTQ